MTLWHWKHIADLDRPSEIYLSRLMLIKTRWFGVYVHLIRRADYARCEHDHPWSFCTIILRGGYEEEVGGRRFVRRPGYVGYRSRHFEHRITQLRRGTALTLVFRGPDHVDWGFRTVAGKIPWQEYVSWDSARRVLWCDDRSAPRTWLVAASKYFRGGFITARADARPLKQASASSAAEDHRA